MDINDPNFFDDNNLAGLWQPASGSDFGPGPNESVEYAKEHSRIFAASMSDPSVAASVPASPVVSDDGDRLARLEAMVENLVNKLSGE